MDKFYLPDGYSLEDQTFEKEDDKGKISKECTVLRRGGEIVFVQPTEHSSPYKVKEVIGQIEEAVGYIQSHH